MGLAEKILEKNGKKSLKEGLDTAMDNFEKAMERELGKDLVGEEMATEKEKKMFFGVLGSMMMNGYVDKLLKVLKKEQNRFIKTAGDEMSEGNVDEKVQNQFFDDVDGMRRSLEKADLQDKDAKAFSKALMGFLAAVDSVDEKDAMSKLDALKKWLKGKKIEESKKEE